MLAVEPAEVPEGALVLLYLPTNGGYRMGTIRHVRKGPPPRIEMVLSGSKEPPVRYQLESVRAAWVMGSNVK
jgi:hypothetical protein